MVTKQQQLEWLAKAWENFTDNRHKVFMSVYRCGDFVGFHAVGKHEITKQEWQQERDKMQKQGEKADSWHECGELPPVGCECEWVDESGVDGAAGAVYPDIGDAVSICAHKQTPGGDVIAIFTWEPGGDGLRVAASRMPSDFRPIRTEREKAIDEMVYEFINHYGDPKGGERYLPIAAKLYDAGYRKEKSK